VISRWILTLSVVLLGACGTAPVTSVGLYGDAPVRHAVAGSTGQGIATRVIAAAPDDVLAAARATFVKLDYVLETEVATGAGSRLTARGRAHCVGNLRKVTMAVYVAATATGTAVTVIFDNHDQPCPLGNLVEVGASQILQQMLKFTAPFTARAANVKLLPTR
jgi:hypothetical protein